MRPALFPRLLLGCLTAAMTLCVSPARGEPTFPYKAYITADDVYIRSGPGKDYYPTDKTKSGQLVEVYRHDPGGWCAIRPPQRSYTWVATRYLEPAGRRLARITSPEVAARVGSRFSDIRDVVQVRLHQDEVVELYDGRLREDREWTRISPPSGEFRWIHSKYLDPQFPLEGVRKNGPPDDDSPDATNPADGPSASARRPATPPRSFSPEEYQRRLDELDVELSVMVSEEPTVWQFDELAINAERMMAQAETALERGRARMLMSKVERFENIKQRYDTVEHVVADADRRDRRLATLSTRDNPAGLLSPSDRFDGRGRLTRVLSPKPGTPRYALVDESGRVTCYVTPSPGMSLRHYEQRTVGITGARGYMPEQRAYHVMAKHIDILGDGQLR
ncbi:MAG TPA: hypothetical protein VJL29_09505 [Thermoguttaceae bacterium]|nr:hypothetical protein [Thermoguttaceae bacterium]